MSHPYRVGFERVVVTQGALLRSDPGLWSGALSGPMRMKSRGRLIIAVVLLLLPVLYLGSYFALVIPPYCQAPIAVWGFQHPMSNYRCGNGWVDRIFRPIEQIDRKIRPWAWEESLDFRFSTGDFDP